MSTQAYLLRESLVSGLINAVISLGFVLAVFGMASTFPIPGVGNYAFDFLPQSFAVSLMSALVPGLLAQKAIASGRLLNATIRPVRSVVLRALGWALCALLFGAVVVALPLSLSGMDAINRGWGIAVKMAYGAVLGAFVTHRSLAHMIMR